MPTYRKKVMQRVFSYTTPQQRITELDFFRGIALLLMVYFHTIWSMNELFGYHIAYMSWVNFFIGRISAIGFILISGIVFSLGKFNLKRFLLLTGMSIIITVTTYRYNSDYVIRFGILHFFALSSLIALFFSKMNKYVIMGIGIGIIVAWSWISNISVQSEYLFFVGVVSKTFQSADYYPLIPWFGVYLIGMGMAKILYEKRRNIFWKIFDFGPINFIWRHTLAIYILHQPIIIGIFYLIDKIR